VVVDGKLEVEGSLEATGAFEVAGSSRIQGEFRGSGSLRVGGKFVASKAVAAGDVDLAGNAETNYGIKGAAKITVRGGSTCKGALVGDRVFVGSSGAVAANWRKDWAGQAVALRLVGRMTQVEDVYAREVHLGRHSRSRRIFAERVELEGGAIADEISYTSELVGPLERCFVQRPPRRVSELPRPPTTM
jgi:cytoskeletal protein CcmA (bactofilin family)